MDVNSWKRAERRGNYSMLMGGLIFVVIGFAAFSVDISLITMSELQAQATADAASHAALVAFRENYNTAEGNQAAAFITDVNTVGLGNADIDPGFPVYGRYDFDFRTFMPGLNADGTGNAVFVQVSRKGGNAVDLLLAPMIGVPTHDVVADSITAQQQRAIMLVQDMSCSMMGTYTSSAVNISRLANLAFVDYLYDHPQEGDKIGLSMFAQRAISAPGGSYPYGQGTNTFSRPPWLPLMDMEGNYTLARNRVNGICDTYSANPCPLSGQIHPTASQIGGCTNPEPAMGQAVYQLVNNSDMTSFRGMIFMSDGVPNCNASGGWDEVSAYNRAVAQANSAWSNDIHIWTILFHNGYFDPTFMDDLVRGIGYSQVSPNASDLPAMYEEVAKSLPTALVY